jgi:hypothetical protein
MVFFIVSGTFRKDLVAEQEWFAGSLLAHFVMALYLSFIKTSTLS